MTKIDPTTAQMLQVFHDMVTDLIEDPEHGRNLIAALGVYCNSTERPRETLLIISAIAIERYADAYSKLMGPMAAIAELNEMNLMIDIDDAVAAAVWDAD